MTRRLRVHAPFGFYHVTLRGNHQQPIFFQHEHREWLNEIVATAIERHGALVHGYCWMTNHVHLVVQVGQTPLGRIIQLIAGRYARKVQAQLETTGHLFENRYHAKLVDEDEYLLALLRYVHLNPVEANLARSPLDYAWSSHRAYAGLANTAWVTTDFALSMLASERRRAVEAFLDFVDGGAAGTAASSAASATSPLADTAWPATPPSSPRPTLSSDRRSLDEVIDEVCRELSVSRSALESPSTRDLARARALVLHRCLRERIASVAAVARRFHRDESTLRAGLRRYYPDDVGDDR